MQECLLELIRMKLRIRKFLRRKAAEFFTICFSYFSIMNEDKVCFMVWNISHHYLKVYIIIESQVIVLITFETD